MVVCTDTRKNKLHWCWFFCLVYLRSHFSFMLLQFHWQERDCDTRPDSWSNNERTINLFVAVLWSWEKQRTKLETVFPWPIIELKGSGMMSEINWDSKVSNSWKLAGSLRWRFARHPDGKSVRFKSSLPRSNHKLEFIDSCTSVFKNLCACKNWQSKNNIGQDSNYLRIELMSRCNVRCKKIIYKKKSCTFFDQIIVFQAEYDCKKLGDVAW